MNKGYNWIFCLKRKKDLNYNWLPWTKISNKNLELNLNIDTNLPQFLNSDSLRIKQVISNLIDNAIKFTDKGKKISIDISYSQNHLNVSVLDEGIGISKDRQRKIFKPFTQADNSTTRKYGGTGLGLTISSQIIELLGGELKLKSRVKIELSLWTSWLGFPPLLYSRIFIPIPHQH